MASHRGFFQMSQILILMLAALDDVFLQIALQVFPISPFADDVRTCRAFELAIPVISTWESLKSVSLRINRSLSHPGLMGNENAATSAGEAHRRRMRVAVVLEWYVRNQTQDSLLTIQRCEVPTRDNSASSPERQIASRLERFAAESVSWNPSRRALRPSPIRRTHDLIHRWRDLCLDSPQCGTVSSGICR
jgi:hypothetical protein